MSILKRNLEIKFMLFHQDLELQFIILTLKIVKKPSSKQLRPSSFPCSERTQIFVTASVTQRVFHLPFLARRCNLTAYIMLLLYDEYCGCWHRNLCYLKTVGRGRKSLRTQFEGIKLNRPHAHISILTQTRIFPAILMR